MKFQISSLAATLGMSSLFIVIHTLGERAEARPWPQSLASSSHNGYVESNGPPALSGSSAQQSAPKIVIKKRTEEPEGEGEEPWTDEEINFLLETERLDALSYRMSGLFQNRDWDEVRQKFLDLKINSPAPGQMRGQRWTSEESTMLLELRD